MVTSYLFGSKEQRVDATNSFQQGLIMSTAQWGGHIIFALSGVCRPSRLVSGHFKEKYLSYLYQIWYGYLLG